nr:DEAD-box ATP-dependent RNA helicase 38 [Tanacetum cinerariifolium]
MRIMEAIGNSKRSPQCQRHLEKYSRCIGREGQFGRKGAVFNLICGDMDKMTMEKFEMHNNVTEVLWTSDEQFEDALKKAGL